MIRICCNKRIRVLLSLVAATGTLLIGCLSLRAGYVALLVIHRYRDVLQALPIVKVEAVDCSRMFDGDASEISRSVAYDKTHARQASDVVAMTRECSSFRVRRKYIMTPVTEEEADFPIAFRCVGFTFVVCRIIPLLIIELSIIWVRGIAWILSSTLSCPLRHPHSAMQMYMFLLRESFHVVFRLSHRLFPDTSADDILLKVCAFSILFRITETNISYE